jgi:hypothetical protein
MDPVTLGLTLAAKSKLKTNIISTSSTTSTATTSTINSSTLNNATYFDPNKSILFQDEILEDTPSTLLHKYSSSIAMSDLAGRVATPMEWYTPTRFVCAHCLLPAEGYCIGYCVGSSINPKNGITQWLVYPARFGSIGCARQYMNDNRYTFVNQTADITSVMISRVYNPTIDLRTIPSCPARTALPQYRWPPYNISELLEKQKLPTISKEDRWETDVILTMLQAAEQNQCQGLALHKKLSIPMNAPDRSKHIIVSEPSTLLIDLYAVNYKPPAFQRLKKMFPGFYMKSVNGATTANDNNTHNDNDNNNKNENDEFYDKKNDKKDKDKEFSAIMESAQQMSQKIIGTLDQKVPRL